MTRGTSDEDRYENTQFMTAAMVANFLAVHPRTVQNWRTSGRLLPFTQSDPDNPSSPYLYLRADVERHQRQLRGEVEDIVSARIPFSIWKASGYQIVLADILEMTRVNNGGMVLKCRVINHAGTHLRIFVEEHIIPKLITYQQGVDYVLTPLGYKRWLILQSFGQRVTTLGDCMYRVLDVAVPVSDVLMYQGREMTLTEWNEAT